MKITGFDGIARTTERLTAMYVEFSTISNEALYEGAKVIADEVRKGIDGIPVEQDENGFPKWGTEKKPLTGITESQKQEIRDSFGIASFHEGTTSIGFGGYMKTASWRYFEDLPVPLFVRTIESGTTFRQKHPFVRPAVNRVKKAAVEAVRSKFTKEITERIK